MKKVIWGDGKFSSAKKPGTYSSFGEFVAKADSIRHEQEQATSYLQKAMPAMLKLLEMRMTSGQPLTVMRPLRYQTSVLQSTLQDDLDKSFYNTSKSAQQDKFVDTAVTLMPGTQLILKGLDPNLQEFIFQDGLGKEHAISYDARNALMTQTDIFETVRNLLEQKGE